MAGLTGPNSACPHGISGNYGQVVERGHGIVNIVIPRLNGYVCENERTFFVGAPSKEQAAAFQAAFEAQEAAAAAFVVGATMADADAAAQRVFERLGYGDRIVHRTGHGIGLAGHEYPGRHRVQRPAARRERGLQLRAGDLSVRRGRVSARRHRHCEAGPARDHHQVSA